MIQDLHSHTYYSYCGKDSPEAVIKNAITCGIELMGISDHYYGVVMNRPGVAYESDEHRVITHNNALKRYFEHIKTLADKYKDYIEVWCGIEITAIDKGFTLLPDCVDVSMFDYCLIENFQYRESVIDDVLAFAKRCGCERVGLAHMDLPAYILSKGLDTDTFLENMKKQNVFWELNVNYDSKHNYREHQYVKDFFENTAFIDAVKKSGIKMSVGFDGHVLEDYDADRVINACHKLEKLSVPMIK
ncbi:MAG: PHP domain-containing protein [Clostridia bacterium]|nr:PHP domain-containing protein [Clostridia bacterium]